MSNIPELGIVFLHHRNCEVTRHHAELLRGWHPGAPFVALTTAEGIENSLGPSDLPDFAAARARFTEADWAYRSSSDVLLAAWWRVWKGARAKRWLVVEWDVWCGESAWDFFQEVWDYPVVLPSIRWPHREQEWVWWPHISRLPSEVRPYAVGTSPFTPMLLSDLALDALASELTLEHSGNIIYELRLPTLLNAAGFHPVPNPQSDSRISWRLQSFESQLSGGFWHPIKWVVPGKERMERMWQAKDVAVVFLTCSREPSYFGQTLASFYASDGKARDFREVAVAVDAPDLGCVEWLRHHAGVRFEPRLPEESERVKDFHLHRRACAAYWRAIGMAPEGSRAVLVFEDDVVFRDGWVEMLLECLNEMQAAGLRDFILAAYSAHDHEAEYLRRGRTFSSYLAHSFFGTQAVLYTASEVEPVREIIWNHGVLSPDAPYDLLVQRWAIERQHLYTTRQSLVQHAGVKTTGLGGHHQSPSFVRPWPQSVR